VVDEPIPGDVDASGQVSGRHRRLGADYRERAELGVDGIGGSESELVLGDLGQELGSEQRVVVASLLQYFVGSRLQEQHSPFARVVEEHGQAGSDRGADAAAEIGSSGVEDGMGDGGEGLVLGTLVDGEQQGIAVGEGLVVVALGESGFAAHSAHGGLVPAECADHLQARGEKALAALRLTLLGAVAAPALGRCGPHLPMLTTIVVGGPDAVEVAHRVRALHRPIKGVNPDGSRYSAMEPEAFACVQATLIDGIVTAATQLIGPPLSSADRERLYGEQLGLARLLGVREGLLPDTWAEFEVYRDEVVHARLTYLDTALEYLEVLRRPGVPQALPRPIAATWPLLRAPGGTSHLCCPSGCCRR